MITRHDLQEAIAACEGEINPNANTCIKLAAFYTIRNELFGDPEQLPPPSYSYAPPPDEVEKAIIFDSDSEFGRLVDGRLPSEILPVIDELVTEALSVANPRLYAAFLRKLQK